MTEKAITQEDFDLAVGHVTSFYQSKRAKLKKQLTHWYGKFMICKAENNRLRVINKIIGRAKEDLIELAGKQDKEITELKEQVKDLQALCAVEMI